MKKIIITLVLLSCISYGKDPWMDVYQINKYMTRYYDKMTHIVCYVYDRSDETMKCFDVNTERLKLKAKTEKKKEKDDKNYDDIDY